MLDSSKGMQEANDLVISGKPNRRLLTSKLTDINVKTIGLIGVENIVMF